ncbi:ABC transporter substrate-binding protein [Patescibacteria group bacterium]
MKNIFKKLKRQFLIKEMAELDIKLKKSSLTEKVIFFGLISVFILSTISIIWRVNNLFTIEVPISGGDLTEGVVGLPRFINPLLASSNTDKDLTALVYSGLLKYEPENGLVPDLAKSYEISDDGLVYTFILKDNLTFHDGTSLTTDDIEFTILKAKDNSLKSPKRVNWDGVKIEKISPTEINFSLNHPYHPFLENTTLGILPKHIWENITIEQFTFSQFNIEPIGSGPYKIQKSKKNNSGIFQLFKLTPFKNYSLGTPYISEITLKFYPNQDALIKAYENKVVESLSGISPQESQKIQRHANGKTYKAVLPRVFGVFFNQNQASVFLNDEVRKVLNMTIDKQNIVDEILKGYGLPLDGPLPYISADNTKYATSTIIKAREILERNGWKISEENNTYIKKTKKETLPLKFSMATSNTPELKAVAELIKETWTKLGADIDLQIFETGDLNQDVIRPRKYDSLLFGEVIGREMDLFAFWHSSQRNDPGLNIAMYANITTDKIIEDIRKITNPEGRISKYEELQKEITKDIPAIFLYAPEFLYIAPSKIKDLNIKNIVSSSERFSNIHKWYIKTDKIWKFFEK